MNIPYTVESRPDTGLHNCKLGIWLFLASEVMLFGALFSTYIILRTGAVYWPQHDLSVPLGAILLVAAITVHLPYGFSSIKLRAVTAAGPQFGPPGYEVDLLYLAGLATLVLGCPGPLTVDQLLKANHRRRVSS